MHTSGAIYVPLLLQWQKITLHEAIVRVGCLEAIESSSHKADSLSSRRQRGWWRGANVGRTQERRRDDRLEGVIEHHVVSDHTYATLNGAEGLKRNSVMTQLQQRTTAQPATHFARVRAPGGRGELKALARPAVHADDPVPSTVRHERGAGSQGRCSQGTAQRDEQRGQRGHLKSATKR
jgi:hypothetical protein